MTGIAWITLTFSLAVAAVPQDPQEPTATSNETPGDPSPVPVHSMHRLIPSVIDTESPRGNHSQPFSPGNITLDTSPFLPSGVTPSYRSAQYQAANFTPSKNFTPSFFIGEVIPEPYVPERFQTSRSGGKNENTRSNQLIPSQTAFAMRKILPFLEHMKHAVGYSMGHGLEEEDEHGHAAPVHEPSEEDEDSSPPKYPVNDPHSDRPSYPYFHSQNMQSTKPVTFESGQETPYSSYDPRDNANNHHSYTDHHSHNDHHSQNDHFGLNGSIPPHHPEHIGPFFTHDNHDNQQKDHLDHFSHHGADFVLPSPFYPPEPEYPSSHHKDVHYKVYQNKPKSALHGLLHFAAALIPLGLFVAALQPSVIHINSSQPMPTKYRSSDSDSDSEVLGLPGLQVLERLGLGRLDGADCERRAFCELAVLGGRPEGSTAQRGLWKLANSIPIQYAATLGLDNVLKAVKASSCSSLKCGDTNKSSAESESSSPEKSARTM